MTLAADSRATRTAEALRWGGWWVVVVCALVRCLVASDPFPYWAIDPGRMTVPVTGLTPALSMSVDAVMLLGCGVALVGEVLAGGMVLWLPVLLWALGSAGVAVNAFAIRAGTIDGARIGATWCAAMGAGLTAMHVCRDEKLKRVTLAAMVGLIAMLAAKGAVQLFHEHAMTVERFNRDREAFLMSQGWSPGSTSAQNFERRLKQPEATGWFGMSNVYATFAATCWTALVGCCVLAWKEARVSRRLPDGWAGVLTLGALAAALAVILAGSKGGYAAAGVGLAMLGVAAATLWRSEAPRIYPRAAGTIAVGLLGLVLAAVVVRGLLGVAIGDRSLLFRWLYMQGAVRAFAENPLFGTGPDGFKDAYMRLKPPLSPEEVSSPHSVLFDFAARLGVFGFFWAGLWIRWVYALGVAAVGSVRDPVQGHARRAIWMVVLAIAVPVLISSWMERSMGSPEQAAARLGGVFGWAGVSLALLMLLWCCRRALAVIAVAAVVAAIHGQIEVTPVWDSSAAWMCLVLGAAGAGVAGTARSRRAMAAPALLVGASIAVAWLCVVPTSRWEVALANAADQMRPMGEFRMRLGEVRLDPRSNSESMPQILADLARLTETPPAASDEDLNRAMTLLSYKVTTAAAPYLEQAVQVAPRHFPTREALVRTLMERAVAADALGRGDEAPAHAQAALAQARELVRRQPTSSAWGLVGNVESALYGLTRDARHADAALEAWQTGAKLDPYGLSIPLQAFRMTVSMGRMDRARELAKKLLELDELQRLDELKKLSPEDRTAAERVSEGIEPR